MSTMKTAGLARTACAALLALAAGATALPAHADEMNWRQVSVAAGQEGYTVIRAGVAIVNGREPATINVRNRMKAPPRDGLLPLATEISLRFEDGSTIVLQADSEVRVDALGLPIRGQNQMSGRIASGSGRYQGIAGSFEMRVRTDIDPTGDGALGDYFAAVKASYTLPR